MNATQIQIPCQKCGKVGGRSVSWTNGAVTRSAWACPHCTTNAPKVTTGTEIKQAIERAR